MLTIGILYLNLCTVISVQKNRQACLRFDISSSSVLPILRTYCPVSLPPELDQLRSTSSGLGMMGEEEQTCAGIQNPHLKMGEVVAVMVLVMEKGLCLTIITEGYMDG